jgi:FkbM family methyltransferase
MWGSIAVSTERMLVACGPIRVNLTKHYPDLNNIAEEILCFGHGLRVFDRRVLAYIRPRVAIDIGTAWGDSAMVMMDFAQEVYSFEPSLDNFKHLVAVLEQNHHHYGSARAFHCALADFNGTRRFDAYGGVMASFRSFGGIEVNVTTLDEFLEGRNVQVGFIKCDTEGNGVPILRGAEQTLKRDRPVVSFAVYHNFDEFFGIPRLLANWLPDYEFWWDFGTNDMSKFHELVFIGCPRDLLNS